LPLMFHAPDSTGIRKDSQCSSGICISVARYDYQQENKRHS